MSYLLGLSGIFLVVMFADLTSDIDCEHLIKEEYIKDHTSRWIQRLCFFLAFGFYDWTWIIASSLMFAALFDQLINIKMDKDSIWYLGAVAKWDIFFSKRKWLYITVKVLCLMTAITLFFI